MDYILYYINDLVRTYANKTFTDDILTNKDYENFVIKIMHEYIAANKTNETIKATEVLARIKK